MDNIKPYHHGDLREALLAAAETIVRRDGIAALTLRATAREAGVSHAAPAHHFKDLSELISELVAMGYERLAATMQQASLVQDGKLKAAARAYVSFAIGNAALFQLMFRVEKLNADHERLREARAAAFRVLTDASNVHEGDVCADQLGHMTAQWCLFHGFATLASSGRLAPLLQIGPAGMQVEELLDKALDHLA